MVVINGFDLRPIRSTCQHHQRIGQVKVQLIAIIMSDLMALIWTYHWDGDKDGKLFLPA
jgi:hypothetical protein